MRRELGVRVGWHDLDRPVVIVVAVTVLFQKATWRYPLSGRRSLDGVISEARLQWLLRSMNMPLGSAPNLLGWHGYPLSWMGRSYPCASVVNTLHVRYMYLTDLIFHKRPSPTSSTAVLQSFVPHVLTLPPDNRQCGFDNFQYTMFFTFSYISASQHTVFLTFAL